MLPPLARRIADAPGEKLLWVSIAALVVGQIIAFWMLCLHQVRKAEVRHATLQVEKMAMADCMQYIPKATPTRCTARIAAAAPPSLVTAAGQGQEIAKTAQATMSSATPVGFSIR